MDTNTVKTIATLARLRVPDDQLPALAGELTTIISWVEQLARVDTSSVEPMASVAHMTLTLRVDVVADGGMPDAVLRNAADRIDDYFTVPKVVE